MPKRWTAFAADPNAAEAIDFRRRTIIGARRSPAPDRVTYLQDQARGKRVLDVGVVNHTLARGPTLHQAISSVAGYCLGVDVIAEAVESMRAAGYNVKLCDITRDSPGETFDVMVVGEVIEHLGNPAAMFDAAGRVLVPGGRLIMTTPNPYYLARVRDGLLGRVCESVDHVTMLFPSGIAELAERAGFDLDQFRGAAVHHSRSLRAKAILGARGVACALGVVPECFCDSLIYECVKPAN